MLRSGAKEFRISSKFYKFSIFNPQKIIDLKKLYDRYNELVKQMKNEYGDLLKTIKYNQIATHEIMETLSTEFGLNYTRIRR